MIFYDAKHDKKHLYTILSNEAIQDPYLTAKAKGILLYLKSLPPTWELNEEELATHFKDGISSIKSGLEELIKENYMRRKMEERRHGKFRGYSYRISEVRREWNDPCPDERRKEIIIKRKIAKRRRERRREELDDKPDMRVHKTLRKENYTKEERLKALKKAFYRINNEPSHDEQYDWIPENYYTEKDENGAYFNDGIWC